MHDQTRVFSEHTPYNLCKIAWGVRLGGLSMPSIMHMPFYFRPRDIKTNTVLYMV